MTCDNGDPNVEFRDELMALEGVTVRGAFDAPICGATQIGGRPPGQFRSVRSMPKVRGGPNCDTSSPPNGMTFVR